MTEIASSATAPARAPYRMGLAAFAVILLLGVIALPSYGLASDTRTGSAIEIASNVRVAEDLYVAAGTLEFAGRASGDVSVAAGRADIAGNIAGSMQLAAGRADIDGTIGGSLRILGGLVRITGTIEGDVLLLGGQLELVSNGRIGGNLILAGGDVDLNGTIDGGVQGWIGDLTIRGTVDGEVDVRTGSLNFMNTARIGGPVTYASRTEANVHSDAQLAQGITREDLDPWGPGDDPFSRASGGLLRTMWALIAGAVLVVAAPRFANVLGGNAQRPIPALPLGLLTLVAAPILAILLLATVVGIPAGIIVLVLFVAALYMTQVVVGMALGRFMLPGRWNDGSRGFHLLAMVIGVILISALRFIPLPYVHGLLMLGITIWGLGAIAMQLGSASRDADTAGT